MHVYETCYIFRWGWKKSMFPFHSSGYDHSTGRYQPHRRYGVAWQASLGQAGSPSCPLLLHDHLHRCHSRDHPRDVDSPRGTWKKQVRNRYRRTGWECQHGRCFPWSATVSQTLSRHLHYIKRGRKDFRESSRGPIQHPIVCYWIYLRDMWYDIVIFANFKSNGQGYWNCLNLIFESLCNLVIRHWWLFFYFSFFVDSFSLNKMSWLLWHKRSQSTILLLNLNVTYPKHTQPAPKCMICALLDRFFNLLFVLVDLKNVIDFCFLEEVLSETFRIGDPPW